MPSQSKSQQILNYFRNMGSSTAVKCAAALGLSTDETYKAIRDLAEAGWLVKVEDTVGIYRYQQRDEAAHGRVADLQAKLWRAAKIAKSYTCWDLAQYSGATLDYAKKYNAFLLRQGIVEKTGKKGQQAIYRCKAGAPATMPRLQRHKATESRNDAHKALETLAWHLVRAIQAEQWDMARDDVKLIAGGLKDIGGPN